jgi:hypothetical protein
VTAPIPLPAGLAEHRHGPWQQTWSGGRFYPLDPRPEDVRSDDVAHALAHVCRFAGHCERFYSVAQHSVMVAARAEEIMPGTFLEGLLHDAHEAYLADLTTPLKQAIGEPWRALERPIVAAVRAAFGLPAERALGVGVAVKRADLEMLAVEARDLMRSPPVDWSLPYDAPDGWRIDRALGPGDARYLFAAALSRQLNLKGTIA